MRHPGLPAILPVTDPRQIVRFAELSGVVFPGDPARRLHAAGGGGEGRRTGVDFAVAMAEKLLTEGVPGPRYITLNRSSPTSEIHRALLGSALTAHA
ncbi:methylenetetrahydrofolate reductase [Streptomyces parvus]|uniref:methylenetetrahydrofolate reductase n=1 Tax=Streptomyces parvus TaxID=66428 RepID=UPI00081B730B|nr:methylenetetrahydrofolate reductase [Streptomyces sp. Termitarium-T10T-6]SCD48222.1 methylenetetrahydrofolate reductase (NADPH) [Streptomyces sp. Termitarium-T10T-6]